MTKPLPKSFPGSSMCRYTVACWTLPRAKTLPGCPYGQRHAQLRRNGGALTLLFNKTRQTSITNELIDIVGGAGSSEYKGERAIVMRMAYQAKSFRVLGAVVDVAIPDGHLPNILPLWKSKP